MLQEEPVREWGKLDRAAQDTKQRNCLGACTASKTSFLLKIKARLPYSCSISRVLAKKVRRSSLCTWAKSSQDPSASFGINLQELIILAKVCRSWETGTKKA